MGLEVWLSPDANYAKEGDSFAAYRNAAGLDLAPDDLMMNIETASDCEYAAAKVGHPGLEVTYRTRYLPTDDLVLYDGTAVSTSDGFSACVYHPASNTLYWITSCEACKATWAANNGCESSGYGTATQRRNMHEGYGCDDCGAESMAECTAPAALPDGWTKHQVPEQCNIGGTWRECTAADIEASGNWMTADAAGLLARDANYTYYRNEATATSLLGPPGQPGHQLICWVDKSYMEYRRDIDAGECFNRVMPNFCESRPEDIRELVLDPHMFSGKWPKLPQLPRLVTLDFGKNALTGSLPELLTPALEFLMIDGNALNGTFPALELPALKHLDLRSNAFSGSFPELQTPLLRSL